MRDEFSAATKDTLARRVGMRCSNPNCRRLTTGPQVDSDKSLNIGVAAHITGASPGGARYDSALNSTSRSAIDNGIWLCQVCAKLVDNDSAKYGVALLQKWKQVSELAASLDVETNRDAGASVEITSVTSINQSGGQTAKTIINQLPRKRSFVGNEEMMMAKLRSMPGVRYEIHVLMNDLEAADIARELKAILDAAGWTDGKVIKGLGGYYPPGITLTRDIESSQSDALLLALSQTGMESIVGQAEFKGQCIGVYIGPNPGAYRPS